MILVDSDKISQDTIKTYSSYLKNDLDVINKTEMKLALSLNAIHLKMDRNHFYYIF